MYAQLPMFHRIGSAAYKANLDNTIAICNLLSNPQHAFKSIHIAGTNGKGSSSHLIASILQEAGYKVGLYTSPHLKDFRERIRINGEMIDRSFICQFVSKHKKDFERIRPSFFEMTVGLAFDYFRQQNIDIAVIETGLGGRLDSTNVIQPLLSLITNISFDHANLLGNTLQKIAKEKAGIIKPAASVVIGESQPGISSVFIQRARECKSEIYFADKVYSLRGTTRRFIAGQLSLQADVYRKSSLYLKYLRCPLPGIYQLRNIASVLMCIDVFNRIGNAITDEQIRSGIQNVILNTGLQGRWQVLSRKPLIIADTGHNQAGIKEVLKQIRLTPHKKLHVVLGVVNDKDLLPILAQLPKTAVYYFCKPAIPRGLNAALLMQQAHNAGLTGKAYTSVKKAVKSATSAAGKSDLVFIGGSTFVVAQAI